MDGFGSLVDVSGNGDKVLLIEDLLKRQLWQQLGGDLWVVDAAVGKKLFNLTERLQQHREAKVRFFVSTMSVPLEINLFRMIWPRGCNSRYLWSLPSIYSCLRMDSYMGQASKWAYECQGSWKKRFEEYGGEGRPYFHGRLSQSRRLGALGPG